jgi:hypothetical protein
MNLIKRQFPSIGRLYDSTLGWDLDFPPAHGDKWIQIIHDGKGHWVVATKSKEIDCVLIYDSLGGSSSEVEEHVIGCISSLLQTSKKSFSYQSVGCQKQLPNDCGLHAIANALSLALGEDPSNCIYSRKAMRYHLKSCLTSKLISPFPRSNSNKDNLVSVSSKSKKAKVYCHCRRIFYQPRNPKRTDDWTIIECSICKEWFHKMCESWPKKSTRGTWLCVK